MPGQLSRVLDWSCLLLLSNGLGGIHQQMTGDTNTNRAARGLIGELRGNTIAISNVNVTLATNNQLLRDSTKALAGFDKIKNLLPLFAAMATLVGSIWSAVTSSQKHLVTLEVQVRQAEPAAH